LIQYTIVFKPSAVKDLSKLSKKIQKRIQGAISTLESNPLPPAAKKLTGRDAYRIRISDYRIIYSIDAEVLTVIIVSIGHRRDVYRK